MLAHGFGGSKFDLHLVQKVIAYSQPKAIFLHSGANEGKTDTEIGIMGKRLSQEVLTFISQYCAGDKLDKISFIGYSLGGCIVRAALPHLHSFRDKFHAFVSLSSPHLGYLYNKGKLFSTGMWLMGSVADS